MNPQGPPAQQPQQPESTAAHCADEASNFTLVKRINRTKSAKSSLQLTLRTVSSGHSQPSLPPETVCRQTPWSISRQPTQDTARQQSTATSNSEVYSAVSASVDLPTSSRPAVEGAGNTTKVLCRQRRSPETFQCKHLSPQICAQPEKCESLSVSLTSVDVPGRILFSAPFELRTPAQLHSELFCCAAQAAAATEAALTVANPPELLPPCRTVRRHCNLLQQINLQVESLRGILHLYKELKLEAYSSGRSSSTGNGSNNACNSGKCNSSNTTGGSSNSENDSGEDGHYKRRHTNQLWPFLLLLQQQMHLSYETLLQTTNLLPSLLNEVLCKQCGAEHNIKTDAPHHQQQDDEQQPQHFLQQQSVSQHLSLQYHSPVLKRRSSKRLAFLAEKKAAEATGATSGSSKATEFVPTSGTAIADTPGSRPATIAATAARTITAATPLLLPQKQQLLLHLELNRQHEGVLKALCAALESHLEYSQSTELQQHHHHYHQ